MTIPLPEQIAEVRRELALRKNAYPRWIKNGTLKEADAERQIARLQAVHDTLVGLTAAKHRGRPCHPNTRAAAAAFHRGRPKSAQARKRISEARKGKPQSEETKQKLRAYWAARRAAGEFKTDKPYAHASAMIAKIPLALSRHIGRTFLEQRAAA